MGGLGLLSGLAVATAALGEPVSAVPDGAGAPAGPVQLWAMARDPAASQCPLDATLAPVGTLLLGVTEEGVGIGQ